MPEIRESLSARMGCSGHFCKLPNRLISKGTLAFVGYARSGQVNLCFDCFNRLHSEFSMKKQKQENK